MLEVDIAATRGAFRLEVEVGFGHGVTALIGTSGAGKSSLLRLIAGLDRPDLGRIALDGAVWANTYSRTHRPVRERRIGMVFQEPRLLAHLSVRANVELGARGQPVPDELMERLGCTSLLDRPVPGLSGGEQQRVMLARALAGNPDLLLLDEPLPALDPASRDQVMALLQSVLPGLDVPVIYVTHAFDEAARLARRFVRLEAGRVAAEGSALDVLAGQGLARQEAAVSSVIAGQVVEVGDDGIAEVAVDGQSLDLAAGKLSAGQKVQVRLWARDLILARHKPEGISARNCLTGTIATLAEAGPDLVMVRVLVAGQPVEALVTRRTAGEMALGEGEAISLLFKSASIELLG